MLIPTGAAWVTAESFHPRAPLPEMLSSPASIICQLSQLIFH